MMKKINILLISSLTLAFTFLNTTSFAEEATVNSAEAGVEKTLESTVETNENITEESKTEQVEATETSATPEEKPIDVNKVEESIDQLIGEKKGEDVPIESTPHPSLIRETLESGEFGISKEELDKYTDEQLEQTMTLFTRYNYDIIGMDYGSYARLLNTLFGDKTVDVNNALTQLAFNPAGFNSFSEMIPRVEELQAYLNTLYPTTSSFIPGITMTNDELIAKLNNLQILEDQLKAEGKELPFGRIAGLIQADTESSTDSSTVETTTEEITESSQKEEVTPTSSDDKKDGFLPKTGEKSQQLGLIGLGALGVFALGFVLKRKF